MSNLGKLSETEMEVMQRIWELATPVSTTELYNIFSEKKWTTSTLSTILNRLIKKGYLSKQLAGKANIYSPVLTYDEYKKNESHIFLNRVHGGSIKSFMAALADDHKIGPDEFAELKEWFKGQDGGQQ